MYISAFGSLDELSKEAEKAKNIFWGASHTLVKNRYEIQSFSAIDKLTNFYNQATQTDRALLENRDDNLLFRVKLSKLKGDIDCFSSHSGYFSEYHASSLMELSKIINKKYQTLSYYGFTKEKLRDVIRKMEPLGIDKLFQIGRTMDFLWFGTDLNLLILCQERIEII